MFNFSVAHGVGVEGKTTYFTNVLYVYVSPQKICVVGEGNRDGRRKEVEYIGESALITPATDRLVEWARANAKEVIDL